MNKYEPQKVETKEQASRNMKIIESICTKDYATADKLIAESTDLSGIECAIQTLEILEEEEAVEKYIHELDVADDYASREY